ncbi:MAG: flagellar motor protein MotD [Gammaproteobacteria bacterium]|nr:flagellar motor protein MotD [Gammaproteobacteria bacterium]
MRRDRNNKRRKRSIVESDNVDRWLVSYADFITLLFAFFVVMYAISSVNDGKYRVLSDTLVEAFKTPPKAIVPIQVGQPVDGQSPAAETSVGVPKPIRVEPVPAEQPPQHHMIQLANRIKRNLQPLIDKQLIKVTSNKLWVEVEINTSILYSSGSAELELEAFDPLKKLAGMLQRLPNYIDVEGYTDNLPINNSVYPSNWELSAARAASVVQLFIKNGVDPDHLSVIGYGEYRPIADNKTVEGRRQNRRVRVVILADKNARRMQEIEQTPAASSK